MASLYRDDNGVLTNQLGITDREELRKVEYLLTGEKIDEILSGKALVGVQGYGLERQQAIHQHLFEGIYEWAGKVRTVPSSKGMGGGLVSIFANPDEIRQVWGLLEQKTARFARAENLSFEQKLEELTDIFIQANHAHPFPEGNGRSLQVFMRQLAAEQGVRLDYSKNNKDEWNHASAISGLYGVFWEDNGEKYVNRLPPNKEPIKAIFRNMASPMQTLNQERQENQNMEKQRVVVMNKSHLLEVEQNGKWQVVNVNPAPKGMKPGVYLLHTAKEAAEGQEYDGQIVHKDKNHVFQKTASGIIKHPAKAFAQPPELGATVSIKRQGDKVVVSESRGRKSGRRI